MLQVCYILSEQFGGWNKILHRVRETKFIRTKVRFLLIALIANLFRVWFRIDFKWNLRVHIGYPARSLMYIKIRYYKEEQEDTKNPFNSVLFLTKENIFFIFPIISYKVSATLIIGLRLPDALKYR